MKGQRSGFSLPHDHLRDQAMPKPKPLPMQERLQELFDYSVTTGLLCWETGSWRGHPAGRVSHSNGYLDVRISQQTYRAHRLVWMWVTGEDPGDQDIDHIDGCRTNNAWHNLRLATRSQNHCNRGPQANGTSGFKGVCFFKPRQKWRARLNVGYVEHHLGYFDTPEEAHAAYLAAAERLHGEFARTA